MPRPRSEIAPRILEAAAERFVREGVDGASLRAIARDAGTNIGMIYYYYATKDDLFAAVVEEVYQGFLADLETVMDPALDSETRLRGLFDRLAAVTPAEFRVLRLVLREALSSSTRLHQIIDRFSRGHVRLVLSTIAAATAEGVLDPKIPLPGLVMSVAALAALPQMARRVVASDAPQLAALLPAPEVLADVAWKVLFEGARPPAED
jgi:AcrR family transcriptional regulator